MEHTKGTHEAFRIENTKEGLAELDLVKKLIGTKYFRFVKRGRHKDRKGAILKAGLPYGGWIRQDMPIKQATHLSIYIFDKRTGQPFHNVLSSSIWYQLECKETTKLKAKVNELQSKLDKIAQISCSPTE